MRSLVQTMRTTGFRSKARKKPSGGYAVTKLGPRPKMVWIKAWKNGVEVRRQVPEPDGSMLPDDVTVTLPAEAYDGLRKYCDTEGIVMAEAIPGIVTAALRRHQRWASAV